MKKLSLIKLITSMTVFGTIGLCVRMINVERGLLAALRGIIGALFLLAFVFIIKKKPDLAAIKKNLLILVLSGAAIGVNWILLFESYSYTTIETSTLCYYMAPVIVIIASPFVLGTKIGLKKWICVVVALVGMSLVSGIFEGSGEGSVIGILLALGAACFYASVTILNKKLRDISSYDTTIVQLLVAGLTILPYTLLCEDNSLADFDPTSIIMALVVALVHTGISYALFFSSIRELPMETVAIFSYLDPIVAVALSLFLKEPMTIPMAIGAVLIILALIASEIDFSALFHRKKFDGDGN